MLWGVIGESLLSRRRSPRFIFVEVDSTIPLLVELRRLRPPISGICNLSFS